MIDDFSYNIIEKFDKVLQILSKRKNKNFTPLYLANELNISELSATKLLFQSEKIGLVRLEYVVKCKNCGKINKVNLLTSNLMSCKKCKVSKKAFSVKDIYFHYAVLV